MDIVIDFDGTVVTHDFPSVGKDIGAVPVLRRLVGRGHRLILFTMRSNGEPIHGDFETDGQYLDHAVEWFKNNGIELWGIQTNPEQASWTTSPKAYGKLIIDDAALGAPLKTDRSISGRPFIDWVRVEEMLEDANAL